MLGITEEKLRTIIDEFDDWVWCNCNDCRVDCHSHAVNTEASKTTLADYIMEKMDKRAFHPLTGAMIQSHHNPHVYYVLPGAFIENKTMHGGWYFMDETDTFGGGPYCNEKDAIEELHKYAAWLNNEVSNGTI